MKSLGKMNKYPATFSQILNNPLSDHINENIIYTAKLSYILYL